MASKKLSQWLELAYRHVTLRCRGRFSFSIYNLSLVLAAGIPDFRSPGVGLYENLKKYKLPYPTAIFEVDYFLHKPKPFFSLAKELYPGKFKPTPCHYFIRLLHEKGQLLRHYTQNIDTLERIAGIPDNKLVEAHGTFHSNHCLGCKREYSMDWMKGVQSVSIPTK